MVRKIRLQRKHFNFIFSTQFQQIAAREGVNYKNEGNQQVVYSCNHSHFYKKGISYNLHLRRMICNCHRLE